MTDEELVKRLRWMGHEDTEAGADRIEALTAKLDDLQDRLDAANKARAHVIKMAVKKQAKLAKAVEAADRMLDAFCVHETQQQVEAYDIMCATLAEIEGTNAP
jgi:hypothetical protein